MPFGKTTYLVDSNGDYKPYLISTTPTQIHVDSYVTPLSFNKVDGTKTIYELGTRISQNPDEFIGKQYWSLVTNSGSGWNLYDILQLPFDYSTQKVGEDRELEINRYHAKAKFTEVTTLQGDGSLTKPVLTLVNNGQAVAEIPEESFINGTGHTVITQELVPAIPKGFENLKVSFADVWENVSGIKGIKFDDNEMLKGKALGKKFPVDTPVNILKAKILQKAITFETNAGNTFIYDTTLGYDDLIALQVTRNADNTADIVWVYGKPTNINLGDTITLDPTFGYTAGTMEGLADTGCNNTSVSDSVTLWAGANAGGGTCYTTVTYWDITSIPDDTASIDDTTLRIDVNNGAGSQTCTIRSLENNASVRTAQQNHDDMNDGTVFASTMTECNSGGWGISTDNIFDLGTSADTDILAELALDNEWGIGIDLDITTANNYITWGAIDLQVTYTLANTPDVTTMLSATSTNSTAIDLAWNAPSNLDTTAQPAINGYRVWNHTSAYINTSLISHNGTQDISNSTKFGAIPTNDSDFVFQSGFETIESGQDLSSLPLTNLLAYYDMESTSGNEENKCSSVDGATNCATSSALDTISGDTRGQIGKIGNSIELSGSGSYMDFESNILSGLTDATICGWYDLDITAPSTYATLSSYTSANQELFINGGTGVIGSWDGGASASGLTMAGGTWEFMCYAMDSGVHIDYYLDGTFEHNNTWVATWGGSLTLGANTAHTENFNGHMDEITIWNIALTESEMDILYASGSGIDMDLEGTMIYDYSGDGTTGNDDHLTITNIAGSSFDSSTSGLVASYPLSETSGNAVNQSPSDDIMSNGDLTTGGTITKTANAWDFTSTDGYADEQTTSALASTFSEYTMNVWLKPASVRASYAYCLTAYDGNTNNFQCLLTTAGGKVMGGAGTASNQKTITSDTSHSTSESEMWTMVYDGSATTTDKLKLYYNGVSEATASGTLADTMTLNAYPSIGKQGDSGQPFFTGVVNNAQVFNRALTQAEITALYDSTATSIITTGTSTIETSLQNTGYGNSLELVSSNLNGTAIVSGTDDYEVSFLVDSLNATATTDNFILLAEDSGSEILFQTTCESGAVTKGGTELSNSTYTNPLCSFSTDETTIDESGNTGNDSHLKGYSPQEQFNCIDVDTGSALIGLDIHEISFWIKIFAGSPTGTATVGHYNTGQTLQTSLGTLDVSTVTSSYAKYTFNNGNTISNVVDTDKLCIYWNGGDASNKLYLDASSTDGYDGTATVRAVNSDATWIPYTDDLRFEMKHSQTTTATLPPQVISFTFDGTTKDMYINGTKQSGGDADTTTLGTVTGTTFINSDTSLANSQTLRIGDMYIATGTDTFDEDRVTNFGKRITPMTVFNANTTSTATELGVELSAYTKFCGAVDSGNSVGFNGTISNILCARTWLPQPQTLTATATGETTVALAWSAPINGTAISYQILQDDVVVTNSTGDALLSSTVVGLTANTLYSFTVKAWGSLQGELSAVSNTDTATTDATAPSGGGGGSSAGGGGSGSSGNSASTVISDLFELNFLSNHHFLRLGEDLQDQSILLEWESNSNLLVTSITIGDNSFTPTGGIMTFPDTPIQMLSSATGQSSGEIMYSVFVPSSVCSDTRQSQCVPINKHVIPVVITAGHQGDTLVATTEIVVEIVSDFDLALLVVMIAIPLPIVGYALRHRGHHKRTGHKGHASRTLSERPRKSK